VVRWGQTGDKRSLAGPKTSVGLFGGVEEVQRRPGSFKGGSRGQDGEQSSNERGGGGVCTGYKEVKCHWGVWVVVKERKKRTRWPAGQERSKDQLTAATATAAAPLQQLEQTPVRCQLALFLLPLARPGSCYRMNPRQVESQESWPPSVAQAKD
jgi:hypothetical protein